jgi:hypothetical protein
MHGISIVDKTAIKERDFRRWLKLACAFINVSKSCGSDICMHQLLHD